MTFTEKILTRKRDSQGKIEQISEWDISEKEKASLKKFIEDYRNGKITGRIAGNVDALLERMLDFLKIGLENIRKDNITEKDTERFFQNLLKDKILSKKGAKPYAMKSKKATFDYLVRYYAWKFPDRPELLIPLKIKITSKKPEPKSLSLDEIDRLYKGCRTAEERYFIAVLFSSGTRAEEFHNIRFSDLEMPKGEESFVKIRIRNEFSKTEGRTISLYYKHVLDAVREYLELRKHQGIKPEEPIFAQRYNHQQDFLNALGKRVLGKNVNYHLFRHSCATWLSNRLNRQQLCIYFGWKFSSPMPDVYIQRKGVEMNEITTKFQATDLEELKAKISKQEYEAKLKNEEIEALKQWKKETQDFISKEISEMRAENQKARDLNQKAIELARKK